MFFPIGRSGGNDHGRFRSHFGVQAFENQSGRPDLIPYGSWLVKPPGKGSLLGAGRMLISGMFVSPPGGRQAGLGMFDQVTGLTALWWGRDDRGRGRSPRLSGLVVAA